MYEFVADPAVGAPYKKRMAYLPLTSAGNSTFLAPELEGKAYSLLNQ
jgi:hypothetical protein